MEQMTGLDFKIQEMAGRIRALRDLEGLSTAEMAAKTGVSEEEYLRCEAGKSDLNFAFIYRCAMALSVNVTDIIEGYSPKLKSYTVTRAGAGQKVSQAHGMTYYNLAYAFRDRIAEPLYVRSIFDPEALQKDIELTTHAGQECDLIIEGNLMVQVGEHKEILGPGDSIYFDSDTPHGMIAVNGKDCVFYAIVLNPTGEPIPELSEIAAVSEKKASKTEDKKDRIYRKYIDIVENENGTPTSITFKNHDNFNFAFDLVDALADREPEKLAMLHISRDKTERRFTFKDIKKASNQCANYFKSLGIKKGDRVMLVLKRHYQFWFAMMGLNKLGAIAIPATNQLQEHDFEYRFKCAGVSAIVCTADGDTARQVDIAAANCPDLKHKLIVNGSREGWRSFDEEYTLYSTHYYRPETDAPGGEDLMLMFFTSGTSG
ncbi:MAG: AMP-binding protein, partial [Clostridia bacterium]|nr:AMP-binding protein [Clostridia bacterium]